MRMNVKTVTAEKIFPVLGVFGSVVVSRKGVLTIGYELQLPTAYTVEDDEYAEMLKNFASAIKVLPSWSIVHRQDFYTYDTYKAPTRQRRYYLEQCYDEHFEGRRYLTHKAYIFISIAKRGHIDKAGQYSGLFGIHGNIEVPAVKEFEEFQGKCKEFMKILTTGGYLAARRLGEVDWKGEGANPGLIQKFMMLGDTGCVMSDIELLPDVIGVHDKVAQAFVIGESDALPIEIDSTSKVASLSGINNDVYLSFAGNIGVLLDCEHCVNTYFVVPPQEDIKRQLEREKKKMTSGITSNDNRLNAVEISDFLDDAYREGLYTVKAHCNIIAWSPQEEMQEVRGKVSAALSTMNVSATYNCYNTPILYYAAIPSNAFEIGKENLMLMELESALTLSSYETFDPGIRGGMLHICDRMRNIPIEIDTQALAREKSIITNYNIFTLGGSGTGKSFFTNLYLRNCYNAGESVFVIDVGDSYEGLCGLINEQTGGKDGAYLSWDKNHPFSFNPFVGIFEHSEDYPDGWLGDNGGLNTDHNGVNFFLSFLQTAWAPTGGWQSETKTILTDFIVSFILYAKEKGIENPIFEDFFQFLDNEISPKVMYIAETKTKSGSDRSRTAIEKDYREHGYWIGNNRITPELLNMTKFVLSLKNYSKTGSYGFLLNDPHPKDLFTSRFTVFEVDKLSQDDKKFYSLCILCIMNAFETKMRGDKISFKNIVIEEAWKAISNETMAPYLAGLWKTARKFNTSAMVVTQEIEDIVNSPVIKTAILDNSATKILLDQSNHMNTFDKLQELLSLTQKDKNIILSMNRNNNQRYNYREVYFNLGSKRSFVAATEVSPQEAIAYESAKDKKAPFLKLAEELHSYRKAIDKLTNRGEHEYGNTTI